MPPSKRQKGVAPPGGSAAGAGPSAARAEGQEPEAAQADRGLDPKAVKEFLAMIQRRDRLGPDFFTDDERQQWDDWLDNQPASAAEAVAAAPLLPVQMPPKWQPRASGSSGVGASTSMVQQEIITYTNAGGRQFGRADRQRQHEAAKPLVLADVPVGSTVAIRRDSQSISYPPGHDTPFYVGDVVGAAAREDGVVETVTIHWRMPQGADGLFCNNLQKPWNLACHAGHNYNRLCDHRVVCREAAAAAGSQDSKFTYTCQVAEVFETKLLFNKSGTIKAESKKRLAQSAEPEGAWDARLGLDG